MKIVIDISEKDYNNIDPFLNGETIDGGFNLFKALEIIKNGKPLPEHHGDCVSKEAIKDMLTAEWTKYMPMELDMNLSFVLDKISALPSVTPQPKKGHWINLGVMPSDLGDYRWCSNCNRGIDAMEFHRNHYNYCPNCGAKMEVEG